jgi:hypothetical protein
MATTAIWKSTGNLAKLIAYVKNPHKTDDERLVTGINCLPDTALHEWQSVKERYHKTGGIQAFHGYQSFSEGEVTPELAHEIGVELAEALWGDSFQVIVSTHIDKESHIHNHLLLNSVSFNTGKRYNDCKATYRKMRDTSDKLCNEHGLLIILQPGKNATKDYGSWKAEKQGIMTWRDLIKLDIDEVLKIANNPSEFYRDLEDMGYELKHGKQLSLRAPGQKRFVRIQNAYGDDYSYYGIKAKIRSRWCPGVPRGYFSPKYKPTVLKKIDELASDESIFWPAYKYRYLLEQTYKALIPFEDEELYAQAVELVDEKVFERTRLQVSLLAVNGIDTSEELAAYYAHLETEIKRYTSARQYLYKQVSKSDSPLEIKKLRNKIADLNYMLKRFRQDKKTCHNIWVDSEDRYKVELPKLEEYAKQKMGKWKERRQRER